MPIRKLNENERWGVGIGVSGLIVAGIILLLIYKLHPSSFTGKKTPSASPNAATGNCGADSDCLNGGTCGEGKCACTDKWTGDKCTLLKDPVAMLSIGNPTSNTICSTVPVTCENDVDCAQQCVRTLVGGTVEDQYQNTDTTMYTCQTLSKNSNTAGLEGSYCLPPPPSDGCDIAASASTADRIPGTLMWRGWGGVDAQGWMCTCEFPEMYPANNSAQDGGACMLNSSVCRHGKWHFPCDTTTGECDSQLSPDVREKLVRSSPLFNGRCDCEDTDCVSDMQCLVKCVNGKCAGQRTGLDPISGVPTCVVNTCVGSVDTVPAGRWIPSMDAPYSDGYCSCNEGSIETALGCSWENNTQPRPQQFLCSNNCSGHGKCIGPQVCECRTGYRGFQCEETFCPFGCPNTGHCIGANKCSCANGQIFNGITQTCQLPAVCLPKPSVTTDGTIKDADHFDNFNHTICVPGTFDEIQTLCTANGWDDWDMVNNCIKYPDCAQVPCDSELCAQTQSGDFMFPITKVRDASNTVCVNPTEAYLNELCDTFPNSISGPINGKWQCIDGSVQNVITFVPGTVEAIEGVHISGSICVKITSDTYTRDAPFVGLYALLDPADRSNLLTSGAAEMFVDTAECGDGSTSLRFMFGMPELEPPLAPLAAGVSFDLLFMLIPSWSVQAGTGLGKPLYGMGADAVLRLTVMPAAAIAGVCQQLTPVLAPEIAARIALDHDWAKAALTHAASTHPTIINPAGFLDTNYAMSLMSMAPGDLVAQAACTSMYCTSFTDYGFKLIIIAWRKLSVLSTSECVNCTESFADLHAVKYELKRISNLGAETMLINSDAVTPSLIDSSGDGGTGVEYCYFIDIVPIDLNQKVWVYNLAAYVAQSDSDRNMSLEDSPCKSPPKLFTVTVEPYTETFCRGLASPDPTAKVPNMHWLKNGMCTWEPASYPNNVAAGDYYCSTIENDLREDNVWLVDAQNNCSQLQHSYPKLSTELDEWTTDICDPVQRCDGLQSSNMPHLQTASRKGSRLSGRKNTKPQHNAPVKLSTTAASSTTASSTATSSTAVSPDDNVCGGVTQKRYATCSPVLNLQSGGSIDSSDLFAQRMAGLYQFSVDHGSNPPIDDALKNMVGTPMNTSQLYSKYYHCGPQTVPATWGMSGSGGSGYTCDPNDVACIDASPEGKSCFTRNTCGSWEPVLTDRNTFSQTRRCYPGVTFDGPNSPCCACKGSFSLLPSSTVDQTRAQCDCKGSSFIGDRCQTPACPVTDAGACNGHGTCQYDPAKEQARCFCDTGYYNVDSKAGDVLKVPAENLMTCNRNECINPDCGETTSMSSATHTITYPDGHKVTLPGTVTDSTQSHVLSWGKLGTCDYKTGLCDCVDTFGCKTDDSQKNDSLSRGGVKGQCIHPNTNLNQFCSNAFPNA